jgi:hypothetical protein
MQTAVPGSTCSSSTVLDGDTDADFVEAPVAAIPEGAFHAQKNSRDTGRTGYAMPVYVRPG